MNDYLREAHDVRLRVLQRIINKNKHAAKQGSATWKLIRSVGFGGSEINKLLEHDTKYGGVRSLIAEKIGLLPFSGNMYTCWGKLFEPVIEQFTELIFDTKLYMTGSMPGMVAHQGYSPDGLAVVKILCVDENGNDRYDYLIILFDMLYREYYPFFT